MPSAAAATPSTLGAPIRQTRFGDILLTEAVYQPGTWLAPHTHDHASLVYLVEGSYRERLGRFEEEMLPGMLYRREAGFVHSNMFGNGGARCLIIDQLDGDSAIPSGSIEPTRGYRRYAAASIRTAGERLAGERWDDDPASRMIVHGLVFELIGLTIRAVDDHRGPPPRWLLAARDRLVAEAVNPPAISALATEAGVHPSHFIRTFRRYVGVRPGYFLHQVRIARACRLLSDRSASLAQVATATGFADQSHFGRVFRQVMGATPARWRMERA